MLPISRLLNQHELRFLDQHFPDDGAAADGQWPVERVADLGFGVQAQGVEHQVLVSRGRESAFTWIPLAALTKYSKLSEPLVRLVSLSILV